MLSSDTLFHFTDSAEKLIGILRKEFLPRFSLEKIEFTGKVAELAFPMVCFCDIPLSQIKNHIETYGSYGIGMSKDWATQKALNPVLYLRPGTALADTIYSMVISSQKSQPKSDNLFDGVSGKMGDFLRYIKPYEGTLLRKGKPPKQVRFYDEREWRYLPPFAATNNLVALTKSEFLNPVSKAHADAQIEHVKLGFEPNHIKYLIISDETEIPAMVEALRDIKSLSVN